MASNDMKVRISADVKGFKNDLKDAKKEVKGFKEETQNASETVQVYQGSMSKTEMGIESFRKKMRQAKTDARDLGAAYYSLDDIAKQSTFGQQLKRQMDAAVKESARLTDIQGDIDRMTRAMASDTYAFDTLKEGISTSANLLGVLASGYAAVTGDQQAYNRALAIFAGTQQLVNAMTTIQNALQKESNIYRAAEAVYLRVSNALKKASVVTTTQNVAAVGAETVAQTADAAATKANDAAHKSLNATMKAGPYLVIFAAISALGLGIKMITDAIAKHKEKVEAQKQAMESATQVIRSYNDAMKGGQLDATGDVAKVTILNAVLHDSTRALEDRKAALAELKQLQPEYNAVLDEEGRLYNDNVEKIDDYIAHLVDVAQSQAQVSALAEVMKEKINASFELEAAQKQIEEIKTKLGNVADIITDINIGTAKIGPGFTDAVKGGDDLFYKLTLAGGQVKVIDENTKGLITSWQALVPTVAAANTALATSENKVKEMIEAIRKVYKVGGNTNTNKTPKTPKTHKTPKRESIDDLGTDKLIKKLDELKKKRQEAYDTGDDVKFVKYDEEINKIQKVIDKRNELKKEYKIKIQPIKVADVIQGNLQIAPIITVAPELDLSKLKQSTDKLGTLIKVNTLKQQAEQLRENFYNKMAPTNEDITNFHNGLQAIQNELDRIAAEHPELKIDFDVNANKEVNDWLHMTEEEINNFKQSLSGNAGAIVNDWGALYEMFNKDGASITNLASGFVLLSDSMGQAGQALEQLGAGSGLAKAGMIAAAIGQITLAFAQAAAAETKSGWGWLVWMGAGLAALTTTIATISKFQYGGIVGGNSYTGDKMIARVNSGEMILNGRQQKNLFDLANKGASGEAQQPVIMDVRLRGDDIYLSQKNKNKLRKLSGKK